MSSNQITFIQLNNLGEPISEELTIEKGSNSQEITNEITFEVEATKEFSNFAQGIRFNSGSETYLKSMN